MKKRSITISGHSTSVTLEDEFWAALKNIAKMQKRSLNAIISEIDKARSDNAPNLSSAIRVFILGELQRKQKV